MVASLGRLLAAGSPSVQESALRAVAAAAESVGAAFAPYVPGVLPHLRRYMDLTQARALPLLRSVECAAPLPGRAQAPGPKGPLRYDERSHPRSRGLARYRVDLLKLPNLTEQVPRLPVAG